MSIEDQVLALIEEGNPVPDPDAIETLPVEPADYLATLRRRSREVVQLKDKTEQTEDKKGRNWLLIGAAAVLAMVVGLAIVLVTQGNGEPDVIEPTPTTVPDVLPEGAFGLQIVYEMVENLPEDTEITGVFRATGSLVDDGDLCGRGVYSETYYRERPAEGAESFGIRFDCQAPAGSLTLDVESIGSEQGGVWTSESTWTVGTSTGSLSGATGTGSGTTQCDTQLCAVTLEGEIEFTETTGAQPEADPTPLLGPAIETPGEFRTPDTFVSPLRVTMPEGWTAPVVEDVTIHLTPTGAQDRVLKVETVPGGPEDLIDLFASEEPITVTEPEQVTIAGLDASHVRLTTTEPALTILPGWTNDVYFVDVAGVPVAIAIQAEDTVFDEFEAEAMEVIETIVFDNLG